MSCRDSKEDPVLSAMLRHDIVELSRALSNGAAVDSIDRMGRSALFYATMEGALGFMLLLIEHDANVNMRDNNMETPLHFAAREQKAEAVEMLLKHGAELEAKDKYGNTPLFRAVFSSRGSGDVINILISRGANSLSENNRGISPKKLAGTIANYNIKQFF